MTNKYARRLSPEISIDVYTVLDLFDVESQPIGHAVKKLLVAGNRGHKDRKTDLTEAIEAIQRALEIEFGERHSMKSRHPKGNSLVSAVTVKDPTGQRPVYGHIPAKNKSEITL